MSSIALDYGSADTASAAIAPTDDAMTDVTPQQEEGASRFYALPTDQAVEAGAQRGPSPLTNQEQRRMDDETLMGSEEASELPDPPAVEGGSDVLLQTLLIEGLPITQLSTSRLFAYLTYYGAQPLGLEWVDDQRCKVVFSDESSARIGLEYLCPAPTEEELDTKDLYEPLPKLETLLEYDPDSWPAEFISSLVTPRKAHRVPGKLFNHVERQAAEQVVTSQVEQAASSLPDDVPEIYREMEQADRESAISKEVRGLKKLRSALFIRHAVQELDQKQAKSYKQSQWYRQHGYEAGREIVPKMLQVGEVRGEVELFPEYPDASARDRPHPESGNEPQRRPGEMMADVVQAQHQQSRQGDLLDRLSRPGASAEGRWGHDAHDRRESDRHGRRQRRPNAIDEADEEREDTRHRNHQREASPGRNFSVNNTDGRTRVKGRGRMKAPGTANVWGDADWEQSPRNGGENGTLLSRFGKGQANTSMSNDKPLADRFS